MTAAEGFSTSTSADARGKELTPSSSAGAAAAPTPASRKAGVGVTPGPTDRQLLAAVNQWARTHGWFQTWGGCWRNAQGVTETTAAVRFVYGELSIAREEAGSYSLHWRPLPVESVREAVDVLCALDILPAELSSAFYAGAESMDEFSPLPLISQAGWVREFARREASERQPETSQR